MSSRGWQVRVGVIVGALRGDHRSMAIMLRMAEQAGEFADQAADIRKVERIIVSWKSSDSPGNDDVA